MSELVPRFSRSRKGGKNNITQEYYFRIDSFYARKGEKIISLKNIILLLIPSMLLLMPLPYIELDHTDLTSDPYNSLLVFLILTQEIFSLSLLWISLFGLRIFIVMTSLLMTTRL
jgi:hypothetical protein